VPLSRELWIERDDFMEAPSKGFHRLVPGGEVRLRGVGIVKCESVEKDGAGNVAAVHCSLDALSRSGMPGADRKVKGTIHWVSARDALPAEFRLYERLLESAEADPDEGEPRVNPNSRRVVRGYVEASLAGTERETAFQFERLGYFVADRREHTAEHPVFNRTVTLRDSFAKQTK
jgi:glutaminyl-tRNA synthetase